MTRVNVFIKKYPLVIYFGLVYSLSWGGVALVVGGPAAIPGTTGQIQKLLPLAYGMMGVSTSVAAVLLTSLLYGRTGLRGILSRLLRWRVQARWYGVALLTLPLLILTIEFSLSLFSKGFLPRVVASDHKSALLLTSIGAALIIGLSEELGWTGFAIPQLRIRYSVLQTGLILGFLWGIWHLLLFFWQSGDSVGQLSWTSFLPALLSAIGLLPAYRILMVWVYDHTRSLLVAMLMHATVDACGMILSPQPRGVSAYSLVLPVALWVIVAAVLLANGGRLESRVGSATESAA